MAAEICESLNWIVVQTMAATIRQLQTEVTDLSFVASDGEIPSSAQMSQKSLLSWAVKTKNGPTPRQMDSQVGNFETESTSSQNGKWW